MARPTKKGLDYFPLDVDFLSDIKVKRVIRACGKESIHILIALLCNIYREEGYYILWNDDLAFLVADEVGAKEGTVDELIKKSVQVGLFDQILFDKYKILTSKGIQNRYITATKERKEVVLESDYLLTNEVNRPNILVNRSKNSVNQGSNQQRKEKESKEKERNNNNDDGYHPAELIQRLYGQFPTGLLQGALASWLKDWPAEMICIAIQSSFDYGTELRGLKPYIARILENWKSSGIDSAEKAREAIHRFEERKKNQQAQRQNYQQVPQKIEEMPDWSAQKQSKLTAEQQAEMAELEREFYD